MDYIIETYEKENVHDMSMTEGVLVNYVQLSDQKLIRSTRTLCIGKLKFSKINSHWLEEEYFDTKSILKLRKGKVICRIVDSDQW